METESDHKIVAEQSPRPALTRAGYQNALYDNVGQAEVKLTASRNAQTPHQRYLYLCYFAQRPYTPSSGKSRPTYVLDLSRTSLFTLHHAIDDLPPLRFHNSRYKSLSPFARVFEISAGL